MPSRKGTTGKKGSAKSAAKTKTRQAAKSGPLPPYGPPINEAIARGNVNEMRKVAASSRKWVNDVQKMIQKLEKAIKDLEG
jgi:hypothetical protein